MSDVGDQAGTDGSMLSTSTRLIDSQQSMLVEFAQYMAVQAAHEVYRT